MDRVSTRRVSAARCVVATGIAAVLAVASGGVSAQAAEAGTACTPDEGYLGCRVFDYTGAAETFSVPAEAGVLHVMAWGAAGGGALDSWGGGGGGFAEAELHVEPGEPVSVSVGGGGTGAHAGGVGGYGGGGGRGGDGGSGGGTQWAYTSGGGGGGGSSRVYRQLGDVVVGGGGGGAAYKSSPLSGGQGSFSDKRHGKGGSDGVGGAAGERYVSSDILGTDGTFISGGRGGSADPTTAAQGGGGGGGGYGGGGGGAGAYHGVWTGVGGGGGNYVRPGLVGRTMGGYSTSPGNRDHCLLEGRASGTSGDYATGGHGRVVLQWGTTEVVAHQGAGQSVEAGGSFADLAARVQSTTAGRIPVPGASVTFTVTGVTGSRFAASDDPAVRVADDGSSVTVTTGDDGLAHAPQLIAGPQPGAFSVRAESDGRADHAVFEAEVVAGAVTSLLHVSGSNQVAEPSTTFAQNLRVVARNSSGAAVQDVPVTFQIQGATGSVFADGSLASVGHTDGEGLAGSARVVAGDSGSVTVVARVAGGPSVTFYLTVSGDTHLRRNPVTGEQW